MNKMCRLFSLVLLVGTVQAGKKPQGSSARLQVAKKENVSPARKAKSPKGSSVKSKDTSESKQKVSPRSQLKALPAALRKFALASYNATCKTQRDAEMQAEKHRQMAAASLFDQMLDPERVTPEGRNFQLMHRSPIRDLNKQFGELDEEDKE